MIKLPKITHLHKHSSVALQDRSIFSLIWRDPYVDWVCMQILAAVFVAVLIVINISTYFGLGQKMDVQIPTTVSSDKSSLDIRNLDKLLKEFDNRSLSTGEAVRGYSGPGDPSM